MGRDTRFAKEGDRKLPFKALRVLPYGASVIDLISLYRVMPWTESSEYIKERKDEKKYNAGIKALKNYPLINMDDETFSTFEEAKAHSKETRKRVERKIKSSFYNAAFKSNEDTYHTMYEELKKRDAEPWCGVQIISLTNGDVMNWIRFEGDISEIFDISFLPNVKNPMMIGLRTAEIRDLITFESDLPVEAPAA